MRLTKIETGLYSSTDSCKDRLADSKNAPGYGMLLCCSGNPPEAFFYWSYYIVPRKLNAVAAQV